MKEAPKINNPDSDYAHVLDELYILSESAVNISNKTDSAYTLSIYRLPAEFLEVFLDIPGRRGGFCIISPARLVIFFDEEPNLITVIGKIRNKDGGAAQTSSKTTQLLKVSFSKIEKEFQYFQYKDNTGGIIDPKDVVGLIINWVVSG